MAQEGRMEDVLSLKVFIRIIKQVLMSHLFKKKKKKNNKRGQDKVSQEDKSEISAELGEKCMDNEPNQAISH